MVDGQLFHGDVTNLFLMNMAPDEILRHTLAIEQVIRPLEPLIVYFHQDDIDQAIRRKHSA